MENGRVYSIAIGEHFVIALSRNARENIELQFELTEMYLRLYSCHGKHAAGRRWRRHSLVWFRFGGAHVPPVEFTQH